MDVVVAQVESRQRLRLGYVLGYGDDALVVDPHLAQAQRLHVLVDDERVLELVEGLVVERVVGDVERGQTLVVYERLGEKGDARVRDVVGGHAERAQAPLGTRQLAEARAHVRQALVLQIVGAQVERLESATLLDQVGDGVAVGRLHAILAQEDLAQRRVALERRDEHEQVTAVDVRLRQVEHAQRLGHADGARHVREEDELVEDVAAHLQVLEPHRLAHILGQVLPAEHADARAIVGEHEALARIVVLEYLEEDGRGRVVRELHALHVDGVEGEPLEHLLERLHLVGVQAFALQVERIHALLVHLQTAVLQRLELMHQLEHGLAVLARARHHVRLVEVA